MEPVGLQNAVNSISVLVVSGSPDPALPVYSTSRAMH